MENSSNGLFLRLEELLALYLNRSDMCKDFSFPRCIFRVGGRTESLVHQYEKVQELESLLKENNQGASPSSSEHIPLRVSH